MCSVIKDPNFIYHKIYDKRMKPTLVEDLQDQVSLLSKNEDLMYNYYASHTPVRE